MPDLTFVLNVLSAVRIVKESFPAALLYLVEGITSDGKTTEDPTKITRIAYVVAPYPPEFC